MTCIRPQPAFRILTTLAIAAGAFTPPAAYAAGPILPPLVNEFSACYVASWNGISFARFSYSMATAGGYHLSMYFETQGLAEEFGKSRFEAASTGSHGGATGPRPAKFEAVDGWMPFGRIRTTLKFKGTKVATEIRPKPPAVPVRPGMTGGTIDPLTALYKLRRAVRRALKGGRPAFVFPIYDGAKRYDLHATLGSRRSIRAGSGYRPVVLVNARINPIAGFDRDERRRFTASPMKIYLSIDALFVPVEIRMAGARVTLKSVETGGRRCDG